MALKFSINKKRIIYILFIIINANAFSQSDTDKMVQLEAEFCNNTIDTISFPLSTIKNEEIITYKSDRDKPIHLIYFKRIHQETYPLMEKFSTTQSLSKEDSIKLKDYQNKIKETISAHYLSEDTVKVVIKTTYECYTNLMGKIHTSEENNTIELLIAPFGSHHFSYCIVTLEFLLKIPKDREYTFIFKNCITSSTQLCTTAN